MRSKEGEEQRRRRAPVVRDRLPPDTITSREDMAVFLARRYPVLQDYARHYMPEATEAAVNLVVGRVVENLLSISHPEIEHGLRYARRVVRRECERHLREERSPETIPTDPLLKIAITGRALQALQRMGPRAQRVIWAVARDKKTVAEIASDEGTNAAVIKQRLHHARRRWVELIGDRGGAAVAMLLQPRRSRGFLGRVLAGTGSQSFAATALVPLLALFAGTPSVVPASVPTIATAPRPGFAGSPPALSASVAAAPSVPAHAEHVRVATFMTPTISPLPLPGYTASTETPDDVTLTAIAAPSDGRPVLVAIGRGNTCSCAVLMRSMDGGATWDTPTSGPPADVDQLAVPPSYPRDPRIFAGVTPTLGGAPYMAEAFGRQFEQLSTLPPGEVAVSAHFDDGDPRVFSAGETAIWSMRIGDASATTPPPHDEVDYSAAATASGGIATLATPAPSPGGPAVFAWVPALAAVPGSAGALSIVSTVAQCPINASCASLGTLPTSPWRLAARNGLVLAYGATSAYLSRNDGVAFETLPLPAGVFAVGSIALVGSDGIPWVSFERADKSTGVARLVPASGTWVDAEGDSMQVRTHLGVLIPVGRDRIIEQFSTLGYRCTAVAGGAWAARCPPE